MDSRSTLIVQTNWHRQPSSFFASVISCVIELCLRSQWAWVYLFSVASVLYTRLLLSGILLEWKNCFTNILLFLLLTVFLISAGLPSTKLRTTHSCGTIDSASAARYCSTTLLRDLLLIWQELPACNLSLPNLFVTWGFFPGTTDSMV
jgi:hypothetical protein